MFPKSDDIDWRYINLSHRTDRLEHIQAQCEKAGISATRFPAFVKEQYVGHWSRVACMISTPNTIGNWLSHTALWQLAANTGRCVGVLEDDAMLCSDFRQRLEYIHANWHDPWDIMYLGATYHTDPGGVWHKELGTDFELTDVRHIHRVYGAFANQGYVINPENASTIWDMVDALMPVSRGSDDALIKIQPYLNCYSFTPGMVFQIDGPSDIGNGWTRFSHFLETLGPHVWCDCLDDFDYDKQFGGMS